jgi:hypothetical protein
LAHQFVALRAPVIDFGQHSGQKFFRQLGADACSLEIENLSAMPGNLPVALYDIRSSIFQLVSALLVLWGWLK